MAILNLGPQQLRPKLIFLPAQYEILLKFRRYFMLVAIATNVVKIFTKKTPS